MQGPPVNLVLLGLLILFFGLQLRGRKEQPYSGWLQGWLLFFLSYVIFYTMPYMPTWHRALEMGRTDALTLGLSSFLLSFLQRKTKWRRMFLLSALIVGPQLLVANLQLLYPTPIWPYEVLTLLGTIGAFLAISKIVPRRWTQRRLLLYGLSAISCVCVITALHTDPTQYLTDAFQVPLLIGAAVLYLASSESSPMVRVVGGVGFLLWAECYAFHELLPQASSLLRLLYKYWDLPKYFVGTAMILELFEAARRDVERLVLRYRLLYENLNMLYVGHPHPMWIYDAGSTQVLSANAAAIYSYGYSIDELLSMSASALELQDTSNVPELFGPELLDPAKIAPGSRRAFHKRKSGDIVAVVVTERKLLFEGKNAIVVLAVDVTEQDKVHQELFHRANHDPLTQLPNRELLADRVAQVLARSGRDGKCAVLLTIDVDYFKRINDTYGHPIGDECLRLVAGRLQSRIRSVDTLARTGGEEFTAIIGGLTRREDAETVAESLRRLFDAPLVLKELVLPVTVSIGGALFPDDGESIETLTKRSDEALYRAKRAGRNCCMFSTAALTSPLRSNPDQ